MLTEYGIIPQWLNGCTVKPRLHATDAFQRLPSTALTLLIESLEDLRVVQHRNPASFQSNEPSASFLGYLQGVLVANLAAYQRWIALLLEGTHLHLEPGKVLGKGVTEVLPQFLALLEDDAPKVVSSSSTQGVCRSLKLVHSLLEHFQHTGILCIFVYQLL